MDEEYLETKVLFVTAAIDVLQAFETEKTQTMKEKKTLKVSRSFALILYQNMCFVSDLKTTQCSRFDSKIT